MTQETTLATLLALHRRLTRLETRPFPGSANKHILLKERNVTKFISDNMRYVFLLRDSNRDVPIPIHVMRKMKDIDIRRPLKLMIGGFLEYIQDNRDKLKLENDPTPEDVILDPTRAVTQTVTPTDVRTVVRAVPEKYLEKWNGQIFDIDMLDVSITGKITDNLWRKIEWVGYFLVRDDVLKNCLINIQACNTSTEGRVNWQTYVEITVTNNNFQIGRIERRLFILEQQAPL